MAIFLNTLLQVKYKVRVNIIFLQKNLFCKRKNKSKYYETVQWTYWKQPAKWSNTASLNIWSHMGTWQFVIWDCFPSSSAAVELKTQNCHNIFPPFLKMRIFLQEQHIYVHTQHFLVITFIPIVRGSVFLYFISTLNAMIVNEICTTWSEAKEFWIGNKTGMLKL